MIKKIDANKYGVVRYAITSVDELNRLPKKIAPSSQAILIENGLRVFVYGDGQWVEEVVDGDLSENMQSIVADYERSKIGYDGVKRGSLGERLKDDFQGIYDILNARDYCEYSGKELKVDNTWMGNQIDTRVEGRTLQNLVPRDLFYNRNNWITLGEKYNTDEGVFSDGYLTLDARGVYINCFSKNNGMFKNNGVYTIILDIKSNTLPNKFYLASESPYDSQIFNEIIIIEGGITGISKHKVTVKDITSPSILRSFIRDVNASGSITFRYMILEGDYTQTPLSELPYLEGIESVGEREIGKNLLDPSKLEYGSIIEGKEHTSEEYTTNRKRSGFIKVKPNTDYVFSSNIAEINTHWWFYDIDKKYLWGYGGYSQTITTPSDCEYIRIHNGHADGTPLSDFKLQVEEGTVATEYEPFGYKIKGKSCGKNLFDGKWEIGGFNWSDGSIDPSTNRIRTINYIKCKSNTTYVFDGATLNDRGIGIFEYDSNYKFVNSYQILKGQGHDVNKRRVGTKANTRYIKFMLADSVDFDDKFIFEESTSLATYEPYQESTYSIHSPIPLRSLPNGVCDVYDFESGAVIQRVGKIVLDGTEGGWSTSTVAGVGFKRYLLRFSSHQVGRVEAKPMCSINDKVFNRIAESHGDYEYLYVQSSDKSMTVHYQVLEDKASSVDDFKLWLQANPTTVYYELEEPIIHYLTPSQLKSFDGTTHVINENTLIPTTTTKILTDTYANVSNVNSTAYSLRRGVNNVAETSAIINETDVEQDDVLDVTMCAIDELYSMLEPNLE